MRFSWLKILILVLFIGCSTSSEMVKIYPINQVEITEVERFNQKFYFVKYYIHFTKNVKRYWIDYWEEINGKWVYVDHLAQTVGKHRAKKTIGVQETFETTKPTRVKIKIRGYNTKAKNNASGVTVEREHIFDIK